ncbi:pseudouridine synthase [Acaryochloris sp. IP29b_bin.148]|uniref:pseudouridine synthase n=1 Tax=Acaryochloris sp. IP29b_bin.148 TaxID=2969218 RepID=UPI002620A717|nr:pseudouridine synthase [Acaryochloris sp. IP29b_bin.148]
MEVRLQKLLSQWGIASRRQAERLIKTGQVQLNGQTATLGQKADPALDQITLNGRLLKPTDRPQPLYLLLHKPKGVVSTCKDPQHRQTVLNLLPSTYGQGQGLHPVGRLDFDSTGALLLTNDGALTFALTHPRHHIAKTYQVWLEGCPPASVLTQWRRGVWLDHQKTLPARIQILKPYQNHTNSICLEVILQEGRNRQIRRIAEQLGYPVRRLHRTQIGSISLRSPSGKLLPQGRYRSLTSTEIDSLRHLIKVRSSISPRRSTSYESARN